MSQHIEPGNLETIQLSTYTLRTKDTPFSPPTTHIHTLKTEAYDVNDNGTTEHCSLGTENRNTVTPQRKFLAVDGHQLSQHLVINGN